MIERVLIKGEWWLPTNPDKKVRGTFNFNPKEGLKLDLLGVFDYTGLNRRLSNFEIILGESDSGQSITLYKCLETHLHHPTISSIGSSGFPTSNFEITMLMTNIHFSKIEDFELDKLCVRFNAMNDWLNSSCIDYTDDDSIKFVKKTDLVCVLKNNYKLTIEFDKERFENNQKHEVVMMEHVNIFIENISGKKTFFELLPYIDQMQDLLSFACVTAAYPIYLAGITSSNNYDFAGKIFNKPVEIIYALSDFAYDKAEV